eukprot:624594-Hanusia_phi.AAC.1
MTASKLAVRGCVAVGLLDVGGKGKLEGSCDGIRTQEIVGSRGRTTHSQKRVFLGGSGGRYIES